MIYDLAVDHMAFGRICLVGDGAFAVRPHAAAGTAKACADAWALRDALSDADGDVVRALAAWEPGQLALGRSLLARASSETAASSDLAGLRAILRYDSDCTGPAADAQRAGVMGSAPPAGRRPATRRYDNDEE